MTAASGADSDVIAAPECWMRRLARRVSRVLRRLPWYRHLERRRLRGLTVTARERVGSDVAERATRFEATWRGRNVGGVWLLYHPSGYPPEPAWWVLSLEVEPALRRLGIAEVLIRTAKSWGEACGARRWGALVRADNVASINLCQKFGMVIDQTSPFPAQWMAARGVTQPWILLRGGVDDATAVAEPGEVAGRDA